MCNGEGGMGIKPTEIFTSKSPSLWLRRKEIKYLNSGISKISNSFGGTNEKYPRE